MTEVWTWRGLVSYYTVFVIDLASPRVQILGSTPYPEAVFMQQVIRTLTMAELEALEVHVLICDRDRKWSREVRHQLGDADIRVVMTPERAPNANAYANVSPRRAPSARDRRMRSTGGSNGLSTPAAA